MKVGLVADVRGLVEPLHAALAVLADESCDRVACLGSTVEGGQDDDAVLEALAAVEAVVVSSPHDVAERLGARPVDADLAGLRIQHATPGGADDVLWLNSCAAPSLLHAREVLREAGGGGLACGDLYTPVLYLLEPGAGLPRRRIFLGSERLAVPDGALLLCPGSVALAGEGRYGGAAASWDSETRELSIVAFDASGRRLPSRRPRILAYCTDLAPHAPDETTLAGLDLRVLENADAIRDDVDAATPDVILLDYHLAGRMTGLDALIALRQGRPALPAPVLAIAGNPADAAGMRAAGAIGALPLIYLRDTFTRLIEEITPGRV